MNHLQVTGYFVVQPNAPERAEKMANMLLDHQITFLQARREEDAITIIVEDLEPSDLDRLKSFLQLVGKTMPGFLIGEVEIWWPMCIDSGPQWVELRDTGELYVTESEIVRGEPQKYEP